MIHQMFVIHDQAADAYLPPFILPTDGMAIRTFKNCCDDETHKFSLNAADYTLFNVGSFSDKDSTFAIHNAPKKLINGLEAQNYEQTPISNEAPILRSAKGPNPTE